MKLERALLFDVGQTLALSSGLRKILDSHFLLAGSEALEHRIISEPAEALIELRSAIRRLAPRLIFVVSASDDLAVCAKLLAAIAGAAADIPVVVASDAAAPDQVFELLEAGAADFVTAPFRATEVLPRAWKLLKDSGAKQISDLANEQHSRRLIGVSPVFLEEAKKIPLIANCGANVLIVGETGTGKELYARAIHYGSARAGRPFMPVNCGAIPIELVENELFGHARGAFTSASSTQVGLIEEANGGTLFLDEIDCLPIFAQVKLLRFLQEKEYRPLGSPTMRRADVRIIAASNLDLAEAVGNGKVRQDLFYRLNIISLSLPPLRDRREDIPLLAQHFLTKYSREMEKPIASLSQDALHMLMVYGWPGNVRELEHAIERAIVLCDSEIIEAKDLLLSNSLLDRRRESLREAKAKEIARFEKNYIQGLLSVCKGNITRAAEVARKNRRAFWQLIQKHHIDVSRFRPTTT
jgi:two-component system response regulator GlrR